MPKQSPARRACALILAFVCIFAYIPAHAGRALETTAVRFTGIMIRDMSVRATEDREGAVLGTVKANERIQIYDFTPEWLYVASKYGDGYVLRVQVRDIVALDPEHTLPYGAVPHLQIAKVAADTGVFTSTDTEGGAWCTLTAGSYISLWYIEDGWATVPFQRGIGYVPVSKLTELTPVCPTVDYAKNGDLIAAFTSFYNTAQTELNIGRITNIGVACDFISNVMVPGEKFSFNDVAGPYRRQRGYMPAPVLINGGTMPGYGGGTCQVSSTLYNVLLQLPKGMTILYRRPHGPAGAKYLPHGVDAAVGSPDLNLVFQNDFDFPIRIFARAQDGALFIAFYKAG